MVVERVGISFIIDCHISMLFPLELMKYSQRIESHRYMIYNEYFFFFFYALEILSQAFLKVCNKIDSICDQKINEF